MCLPEPEEWMRAKKRRCWRCVGLCVLCEWLGVSVHGGEEGANGRGGERMIETSNQSRCREQRASRRLLPAVTQLSVLGSIFLLVCGSIYEWRVAWRIWQMLWHAFLIHYVITYASPMYTAQDTREEKDCKLHPTGQGAERGLLSLVQRFRLSCCHSNWYICICSNNIGLTCNT